MITAIAFTAVFLVIFLILTEVVSIELKYYDGLKVEINFILFGIYLEGPPKKRRSKHKKAIRRPSAPSIIRFAKRLLKSGKVSVNHAVIPIPASEPHSYALRYGALSVLISSIANILEQTLSGISVNDIFLPVYDNNNIKPELDISAIFSVRSIVLSASVLLYDYIREGWVKKCKITK